MKHVISAMPTLLRVEIANMLQYRAEIALWAAWGIVSPAVLMAVWTAAAAASKNPGHIGSLSTGEMLAYFLMTMIVGHLGTAWDIYEMGWRVRTGRLSPELLRPILPIWEAFAANTAYKLVTMIMLVPIWGVIALIVRPTFHTSARDAGLAIFALVFSWLLNFVWGYAIGCLAFFFTKMDSVGEMWFGASLFFGGRMAPIELLPKPLRFISDVLPFRWIMAYPSELLAGQLKPDQATIGLVWQAGWLIVGIFVFRLMWGAGLKRYSAVGA